MSSGDSDKARHKPAYAATEASMRLEILVKETRHITLSRQQTTKVLIRLRGCAGWSAPLLFAYGIRHVFSWPSSFEKILLLCKWQFHSKNQLQIDQECTHDQFKCNYSLDFINSNWKFCSCHFVFMVTSIMMRFKSYLSIIQALCCICSRNFTHPLGTLFKLSHWN